MLYRAWGRTETRTPTTAPSKFLVHAKLGQSTLLFLHCIHKLIVVIRSLLSKMCCEKITECLTGNELMIAHYTWWYTLTCGELSHTRFICAHLSCILQESAMSKASVWRLRTKLLWKVQLPIVTSVLGKVKKKSWFSICICMVLNIVCQRMLYTCTHRTLK